MNLGRLLNTVDRPIVECPGCHLKEPMQVYLHAVRWRCGYTRPLPPIAPSGRRSARMTELDGRRP